jgi:hypothetical protein
LYYLLPNIGSGIFRRDGVHRYFERCIRVV